MISDDSLLRETVVDLISSESAVDRFRQFLTNSDVGTRAGEQWVNSVMDMLLQYTAEQDDVYDLFDSIREITAQYLPEEGSGVFSQERWTERAQNRARYIVGTLPSDFQPRSILDVGCSEGSITSALREYYEIPAENVHGIDVRCDTRLQEEPDFTFTQIEAGQTLPFEDGFFDLITASMVLHHVSNPPGDSTVQGDNTEGVVQLLDELYRVMSPGGYIVITEHDIDRLMQGETRTDLEEWRISMAAYLNMVHAFYDIVLSNPQSLSAEQFDQEYSAVYRSAIDWSEILISAGYLKYNELLQTGPNIMNRFTLVGHKAQTTDVSQVEQDIVQLLNIWTDDQLYEQFLAYIRAHPLANRNRRLEYELIQFINRTGSNTADDYELYRNIRQLITINIRDIRSRYTNKYLRSITNDTRSVTSNNTEVVYSAFIDSMDIESIYNRQRPGNYVVVMSANAAISIFDYYIFGPTAEERQLPTVSNTVPNTAELLSSIGYVYTDITTSSPGGVSYSLYRKPPTAHQEGTVKTIQQHYDSKQPVPLTESRVRYARSFNNWVKSTLINTYVRPGDLVIDFAGGRGGDILKYMHAGAAELLIIDLSEESIREAQERAASIRNKTMIVRTMTADIGTNIVNDIANVMNNRNVSVVSIQFALHYLLDDWDRFYTVLDNMDALLKVDGYAIITVPDAAYLRRRLQNTNEFGNELYRITVLDEGTDDRPMRYSFYLEDAIDNLPEYIVDVSELNAGVQELGWELILDQNFTDYYKSSDRTVDQLELMKKIVNFRPDGTFPADNWEIVQIYKVLVYQKTALFF